MLVEVLRRFDVGGVEPDTLSIREPSLDDVFLALTGHRAASDEADDGRRSMKPRTAAPPLEVSLDRRIPMGVVRDTLAIVQRNLIAYRRVPQLLVFSTIQPVIFVVMFRYVFGGAVAGERCRPGVAYVDYLMPGIFVQTVVFGAIATSIGLASDHEERPHGAVPRTADGAVCRALRAARSPTRSATSFVVTLMMVVGFLVGWRIHTDVWGVLAGAGLVVLFGFSMSWIFATLGLAVGDPEAAQAAAFPVLAPLVFASSAFVPTEHDARVAAGVRRASAGVGHGLGGAGAHARRARRRRRHRVGRVERRHHHRVRHDRGPPIPPRGLIRWLNRRSSRSPTVLPGGGG